MKKIAILLANLYDDKELIFPYYRFLEAGYEVDLIGAKANETYKSKVGLPMKSNVSSNDANPDDYVALFIPGGFSPDYMRRDQATIDFTKAMCKQDKPIGAICHGPWMMISGCDLKGKTLTGVKSIKDDIENAGGKYVDQALVIDGNLITSRNPNDLPVFAKAMLDAIK